MPAARTSDSPAPDEIEDQGQENDGLSRRACTECSRLKRKCDRTIPCGLCIKLGKQCIQPTRRRRTKEYVDELESRLNELQRLSSERSSMIPELPRSLGVGPSSGTIPSLNLGQSSTGRPSPGESSRSYINESNERNRDELELNNFISPSSADLSISSHTESSFNLPQSLCYDFDPSSSSKTIAGLTAVPGPSSSSRILPIPDIRPTLNQTISQTQNSLPSKSNLVQDFQTPSSSRSHINIPPASHVSSTRSNPPTSEVLERQPSTARGYEWNERYSHLTIKGNDGYASLSIKPDGQGYLGFASGSTLLRILQICAGSIPLTNIDSDSALTNQAEIPRADWRPTTAEIDNYLAAYFELYHPQYPLFHEPTFRAQWSEIIPSPKQKEWEFLCNIVLSVGAFCSYRPMYVVDYFLELAISLISAEHLECGSLTLVQAFCVLSNLSQKRNKPNSNSVYMGIAIRQAIGLGLHRELPFWNITPFERETRRRLWCACVAFDAGASITFGRPILQPTYPAESDVRMVHNVHDKSFTPNAKEAPVEVSEPTIYSAIIWHARFIQETTHIYAKIQCTAPAPTAIECLQMDYELEEWSKSIPEYLRPSLSNIYPSWLRFAQHKMFWRYCNFRIILHRRLFLERALRGLPLWQDDIPIEEGMLEAEMDCCKRCQNSAAETINSINDFFQNKPGKENRLEDWYGLHFLFQASFIPLIALHTDRFSMRRSIWEEQIQQARSILNSLKDDPMAERCLQIINLLQPTAISEQNSNLEQMDVFAEANNWLDDIFQSNPQLGTEFSSTNGTGGDWAQNLMPFADLGTLSSIWPGSSNVFGGNNGL
ncbi:uncharacterized protein I206_104404 [Kwoniella pini CBS 10737]|uniref:Zn(2)-C6 fungal-type domain-containing protein n=1 Tax=Kwoniella pini CBS 10737 TaxID=1296096 RepID=A0A1B9I1T0_9TREE|nr:uncharacterized protein I206_04013 [Kwoniella pini CBS 10737]OCF49492.1 hypothetical protein I206_04013 [Kwoniella pini CBS 10737]